MSKRRNEACTETEKDENRKQRRERLQIQEETSHEKETRLEKRKAINYKWNNLIQ